MTKNNMFRNNRLLGDTRGATLLELIIGLSFVVTLLAVVGGVGWALVAPVFSSNVRENATVQARTWVREMYPESRSTAVSCQGSDTDHNGYVSCTIRVADQHPTQIECASYVWFDWNRGCRVPRFTVPMDNN